MECMIWNDGSVWLQTVDGERVRTSYVGHLSLTSVQEFCARKRLYLVIRRGELRPDAVPAQPQPVGVLHPAGV